MVRCEQIQSVLHEAYPTWRELGDRLLDWPDEVHDLLDAYVQANAVHFVWP